MITAKEAAQIDFLVNGGPVRVEVTAEDIKLGEAGCTAFCPVALAVARTFGLSPVDELIGVTHTYVRLGHPNASTVQRAYFADEVSERIGRFDHNRGMEPFSVDLTFRQIILRHDGEDL